MVAEPDASSGQRDLPAGLFSAMLADPVHAPERLAIEAVRVCGPEAARWAERVRRERPHASTADLAMATRERFTRLSQASGAATGAFGLPGAVADMAVVAWNQARMILYLAALHHLDPRDPERAAEILYFTDVHKAIKLAEKAVAVTRREAPVAALSDRPGATRAALLMQLSFSLGRMLGKKTVKKLITRAIPFGAIPVSAWSNGRTMGRLADRVVIEYARRLGVIVQHRAIKPSGPPAPAPGTGWA